MMEETLEYTNLQFHEKLGEGAYGTVNRVTFKKPYKGYKKAAAKSVWSLREEEVAILSKLCHPNIVKFIAFYQNGPINVLLMEYAENGSLHAYLADKSKPLPEDLMRKWAQESALAIQYLHKQCYLHRDIKPQNCLLFTDNTLKLCDFGLATELDASYTMSSTKGTYQYMAPEIIQTDEENRSTFSRFTDIYAYGMLLQEICTRKPPFDGMAYAYVVYNVGSGLLQPVVPKDCPKDFAVLMKQCWNTNPKKRPTIDDILEELNTQPNQQQYPGSSKGSDEEIFGAQASQELLEDSQRALETDTAIPCQWTLKKEINPKDQGIPMQALRVTCYQHNEVIVGAVNQLYIIGDDGGCKLSLTTPEEDDQQKQIGRVWGIAVSSEEFILVIDTTKYVKVFDRNNNYLHSFQTVGAESDPNTKVCLASIATDRAGHVLVGDSHRNIITVHTCPDGKITGVVNYSINSGSFMVVNSRNQILHHFHDPRDSDYSKVVAIDYSGQEVFAFTPRIDEDMTEWVFSAGLVCDDCDNIYVAMHVFCNTGTGHIHKYSPTGEFLQCIAKGLFNPLDLAISPDGTSLILANLNSVQIYSLK